MRRDLLRLFFSNPEKEYYLRELERDLGYSVANIRRDLLKLERQGLFRTRRHGNRVYYSLNQKYPLFGELKSIVFKTIGVEGALREMLRRIPGVGAAWLYGSFASGQETATSDIDLLIVGAPDEEKLLDEIEHLEGALGRDINYAVYPQDEFEKKRREHDSFIENVMSRAKVLLAGEAQNVR